MLRRRSSIWISGDGSNDEDDLEHVGLLAEIPNDSICEFVFVGCVIACCALSISVPDCEVCE